MESGDALEALMHDVRVWVQEGETEKLVAEEAKARDRLGHAVNSRGIKRYLKREWHPLALVLLPFRCRDHVALGLHPRTGR